MILFTQGLYSDAICFWQMLTKHLPCTQQCAGHWDTKRNMTWSLGWRAHSLKWTLKYFSSLRKKVSYLGFLKLNVFGERGWKLITKDSNLNSTNKVSILLLNMNLKWKKNWSCHSNSPLSDTDGEVRFHHQSNTLTLFEPTLFCSYDRSILS